MSASHEDVARDSTDDEVMSSPRKKARSLSPPDLIVRVGSGKSAKEFPCHKDILCQVSEAFDNLIYNTKRIDGVTGRIELPKRDPNEWEQFYAFIGPHKLGRAKFDAKITVDNVVILLSWFHEYMLEEYVEECDKCLANMHTDSLRCTIPGRPWCPWSHRRDEAKVYWDIERHSLTESETEHQTRLEKRREVFNEMLEILDLAEKYGLKSTREIVGAHMGELLRLSTATDDLFSPEVFTALVPLILPLELGEENQLSMGEGGCQRLWPAVKDILFPHLSSLTQEILDSKASLPLLLHSFHQTKVQEEKAKMKLNRSQERGRKREAKLKKEAEQLQQSAKRIMNTIIQAYPSQLFEAMPNARSMGKTGAKGEKINAYVDKSFKRTLFEHHQHCGDDFKRIGVVSLPDSYKHFDSDSSESEEN